MKTIEERAIEKYDVSLENGVVTYNQNLAQAYISGATEQKAIDIDKACEWLKQTLKEIGYDEFDCGYDDTDEIIEDFKKAMEE